MSTSNDGYNGGYQLPSDAIALKNKDQEKQPLIPINYSSTKRLDDINSCFTSGEEGDDEEDSNEPELFWFATFSQVSNIVIGIYLTSN